MQDAQRFRRAYPVRDFWVNRRPDYPHACAVSICEAGFQQKMKHSSVCSGYTPIARQPNTAARSCPGNQKRRKPRKPNISKVTTINIANPPRAMSAKGSVLRISLSGIAVVSCAEAIVSLVRYREPTPYLCSFKRHSSLRLINQWADRTCSVTGGRIIRPTPVGPGGLPKTLFLRHNELTRMPASGLICKGAGSASL